MNNLVQCTRCKKVLVNEEYESHRCMPEIKDWKTVRFASHYIIKDEGKTLIGIRGLDGISYEFLEVTEDKEHTKIPFEPKNLIENGQNRKRSRTLRRRKSERKSRRLNSVIFN